MTSVKLQYNYSIIIPHKNIPILLIRCLKSIPIREDIQVIVVDDDSEEVEKYHEKYPEIFRPNVEFYHTKESKGAGFARNIGLNHAKGKWLIFADADDFFVDEIDLLLNKFVDSKEDIIYFDFYSVKSNDISQRTNRDRSMKIYNFIKPDGSFNENIISKRVTPWAKIIRREFVEKKKIRFQEIPWGNDVYFSIKTGVFARRISVINELMYVVTERKNSLSYNLSIKKCTIEEIVCRTFSYLSCLSLFKNREDIVVPIHNYIVYNIGSIDKHNILVGISIFRCIPKQYRLYIYKKLTDNLNFNGHLFWGLIYYASFVISRKQTISTINKYFLDCDIQSLL